MDSKFKRSTARRISDYARKVLLQQPVKIKQHNQSLDDFMAELIVLRNELNAIGNNYNQVVHKLHTLEKFPDIQTWLMLNESSRKILLDKVGQIKSKISQINDQWLAV
jgi:uncharacterized protein YggL (DUF469 family)